MSGYLPDFSMSYRAAAARSAGRVPLSGINRAALDAAGLSGLPVAFVRWAAAALGADEWHHTSKRFNKTDFYDLEEVAAELLASGDERLLPPLSEMMARWRQERAAGRTETVHRGATVRWLEWPARRGARPVEREESGCVVVVRGASATITLPGGQQFVKRLDTAGFSFRTREQLAADTAARAQARRDWADLRRRWESAARGGGFESTDWWDWDSAGRDSSAVIWRRISKADAWAAIKASGLHYGQRTVERIEAGERDMVRVGLHLAIRRHAAPPPGTDAWRVSGWMNVDGQWRDVDGWIVADHHVAGYGHDEDQIARALGQGLTRAAAIADAWAYLRNREAGR